MDTKNPIQVADRIFQTIELLAETGPSGLTDLSGMLELNKSTVHRILNSLIYMGYVKQDPNTSKYSLSLKIWGIANQLLTKIDLINIARPYLRHLADATGETVHLVQIDGVNGVYIDKVESYSNSIRMVSKIGKSIPLYCSGVGKAMLAEMDEGSIKAIWNKSELVKYTENTIMDFDCLLKRLEEVRENGYALDDEENELGVRCIAVCLKDYRGWPKYALSISAPVSRMADAKLQSLAIQILETRDALLKEWYSGIQ